MNNKEDLKWGPIAQGFYNALLWLTVVVGFAFPQWLFYYLLFLVFLGLGLRPLLLGSGLYGLLESLIERFGEWRWRKTTEQRRQEIARKQRDARYRGKRVKDPGLPKNW